MYNTPPTWGIYMAGLTFQWLKRQREGVQSSGIAAIEQRNIAKRRCCCTTPSTNSSVFM